MPNTIGTVTRGGRRSASSAVPGSLIPETSYSEDSSAPNWCESFRRNTRARGVGKLVSVANDTRNRTASWFQRYQLRQHDIRNHFVVALFSQRSAGMPPGFTAPQAQLDQVVLSTCHYVAFTSG